MVKRSIIWRIEAKNELKEILQYIKSDSVQNALRVRNDIIDKVKQASLYPESFTPDKYKLENDGTYRAFELHRYRISYQVTDTEIRIVRIRHTSQSPLSY